MPFRLDENRTKMQFIAPVEMPNQVYRACVATDIPSNTRYIQIAVCERLARDLGLDLDELLARLPATRDMNGLRGQRRIGSANTVEEVR
jgi:hypothetical protein